METLMKKLEEHGMVAMKLKDCERGEVGVIIRLVMCYHVLEVKSRIPTSGFFSPEVIWGN